MRYTIPPLGSGHPIYLLNMNNKLKITEKKHLIKEDALDLSTHKPRKLTTSDLKSKRHPTVINILREEESDSGPAPYIRSRHQQKVRDISNNLNKRNKSSQKFKRDKYFAEPQMFTSMFQNDLTRGAANLGDFVKDLDADEFNDMVSKVNRSGILDPAFIDNIKAGTSTTNAFMEQSKKVFDFVNIHGKSTIAILSLVTAISGVYSFRRRLFSETSDTMRRNFVTTSIACLIFVASTDYVYVSQIAAILKNVWNKISEYTTSEPTPQMDKDDLKDFGRLSGVLLACYSTYTTGKNVPVDIFKNFSIASKVGDSFEVIARFVIKALEVAYNFIAQNMFGEDKWKRFVVSNDPEFELILERADEIESLLSKENFIPNLTNFSKLTAIVIKINEFLRKLPRSSENSNLCAELANMKTRYQKMVDTYASSGYTDGNQRIEPVTLMFRGAPGTHKTLIMNLMSLDLAYNISDDITKKEIKLNPKNYVFYRRTGEKYWDSYHPAQVSTVIDDFGQSVDVAGAEASEYLEIIRMVNTAPYPLRMGDVSMKGNFFFNSKFVFMTTNLNDIRPVSVFSADAVKRRIHFLVTVKPKPEFSAADGSFDVEKLPVVDLNSWDSITDVNPDMALYDITSWDGSVLRSGLQYSDLRREMLDLYKVHKKRYEMLCLNMQKMMPEKDDVDLDMEPVPQMDLSDLNFGRPSHTAMYGSEGMLDTDTVYGVDELRAATMITHKFRGTIEFNSMIYGFTSLTNGIPTMEVYKQVARLVTMYGQDFVDIFLNEDLDHIAARNLMFSISSSSIEPLSVKAEPTNVLDRLRRIWSDTKALAQELLNSVLSGLKSSIDWIKSNLSIIVGLGLLITIPAVLEKLTGMFSNMINFIFGLDITPEPNSEVKQVSKAKLERNSRNIKARVSKTMKIEAIPHIGSDANGVDILTSIMNTNAYDMYLQDSDGTEKHIGFCIAIVSNVVLMPWHFITHLAAEIDESPDVLEATLYLKRQNKIKPLVFAFKVRDLLANHEPSPLEKNDLVLVKMPRNFNIHRDITGYFLTDELVCRLRSRIEVCISYPKFGDRNTTFTTAVFSDVTQVKDIDETFFTLRESFQYNNVETGKGDCGAIVSHLNPAIPKTKILGIHVAGNTSMKVGWCSVVTQTDLREALKLFNYDTFKEEPAEPQGDIYFSSGQFNPMGMVDKTPKVPEKTALTKSQMYGTYDDLFTPDEGPAPIHNLRLFGVARQMFDKYYVARIGNRDYSREVHDELCWLKDNSPVSVVPRIFSFEEAVKGIPNTSFKSVDRSTSSGYPYNLTMASTKKSYFFGNGQDFDLCNVRCDKLQNEVQSYIDACKLGKRVPQPYSSFPKDELRPLAKIATNSIRLISGCTLVYLLAVRMYFGAFMTWIMDNNVNNGTSVGTNTYSNDWDLLANKLLKFSRKIGAGDYSGFDGSIPPDVMWAVLDLIDSWYSDGNGHIRRLMWYEIVNSWHVFCHHLFEFNGSMPSGNPLTTIINCLVNKLVFRAAWRMLHIPRSFSENVYLCTMGDDNIFSVHESFCRLFNEYTIIEPLAALGFKYTTETKEVLTSYISRDITQVEFLKRQFVYNDVLKRWVAPLRLSKALEMPYWTKKYDEQTTKDKVGISLVEIALRGREFNDKYNARILKEYEATYGTSQGWFKTTSYIGLLDASTSE